MSGSRKSLQRAAQSFNPRAENSWSKDESKFGQRMLEKMGWKKGEGIGRNGQGVTENIKIRWKLDSKGLGFSIKEDEWVAVEHDFSNLLSNLNRGCTKTKTTKSLESTSSSSRSRVHYRKFIRGKDISKYSKKDLSGILGRNADVSDEYSDHADDKSDDCSAKQMKFSFSVSNHLLDENVEETSNSDSNSTNDLENVDSDETPASTFRDPSSPQHRTRRKKSTTEDLDDQLPNNLSEIGDSSSKNKSRKRKLVSGSEFPVSDDCIENCDLNSASLNYTEKENAETNQRLTEEFEDSDLVAETSNAEDLHKVTKKKSSSKKLKLNSASSVENSHPKRKVKKKKFESDSDLNQNLLVNEDEQSVQCDPEIDTLAPIKKRKKKAAIDSNSKSVIDDCENEMEQEKDPKAIIEEFERNQKALLQKYRESFLRSRLESSIENNYRIYCDLNGDELDCKKGDGEEADELKTGMQPAKHAHDRPLTKAERIVLKTRLLKTIQSKTCPHSFAGSNLNDIVGYGNKPVST